MCRIGIVGTGHLGKIHIKCMQHTPFTIAGIYDSDPTVLASVSEELGVRAFDSYEALLKKVDAVDVVCSTQDHFAVAEQALKMDKHVFIEKPITATLEQAYGLEQLSQKHPQAKIQIGHVERYNPAFRDLNKKNLKPQFIEIHRLAGYNDRGTDVSVVLDLMIHDLDVLLSIVDADVKDISAKGVSILSDTFDICNARVQFSNACVANITASRISLKEMRKMRIFQDDAYINIDFLNKSNQIIRLEDEARLDQQSIKLNSKKGDKYLSISTTEGKEINAIVQELDDFYNAIVNNKPVSIGLQDGISVLDLATRIEKIANETS